MAPDKLTTPLTKAFGISHPIVLAGMSVPPLWLVNKFHQAGTPVANMVGAPKHCERALKQGVDIIIAQGSEGGGALPPHGGHTHFVKEFRDVAESSTLADLRTLNSILLPACVDAVQGFKSPLTGQPILVIAAGGIHDGKGLAAALACGAVGVWVGTRFVCALEAGASAHHQNAVISTGFGGTIRTLIYSGRPLRVKKTPYVMDWEERRSAEIVDLTSRGVVPFEQDDNDSQDTQRLLMGSVCAVINSVEPASSIVNGMVSGALEELRRVTSYVAPGSRL